MLPEDPSRPIDAPPEVPPAHEPSPTGLLTGDVPVLLPVTVPAPRRGGWILGVAVALVAVLGGGALFMSGFVLGQRTETQPGTPGTEAAAFQPFWDAYDPGPYARARRP
jgi:hypothetical protein